MCEYFTFWGIGGLIHMNLYDLIHPFLFDLLMPGDTYVGLDVDLLTFFLKKKTFSYN